ncbi:hypothetical protein [Paenibacillus turpanensis]|uniref:hypothetical protein n=1 Tax=Paenibacillus turpanensis TaxID=2689078 RepID=UPI0014094234|nr:hypothetical protein [Paenibacillus turpanensis]
MKKIAVIILSFLATLLVSCSSVKYSNEDVHIINDKGKESTVYVQAKENGGESDVGQEQQQIPADGSDLWDKSTWTNMAPTAQIIGNIEKVNIKEGNLISLDVKVETQITEHGTINKDDVLSILFYEKLPDNDKLVEGQKVMTQLTHYKTKAGRDIEWGGQLSTLWHQFEGKIYNAYEEAFEGFSTFAEYAKSRGK